MVRVIPAEILSKAQEAVARISARMEASSTLGTAATEVIAEAIAAERERPDKPATAVYGDLLWRHMDACRKHGVPSPEQDRMFKLIEEFRAVYPDECKVWEDRYPGRSGERQ